MRNFVLFVIFRKQFGEKIIRKIEKWSVIVYFLLLVIFNLVYWWNLMSLYPGWVENGEILNRTTLTKDKEISK